MVTLSLAIIIKNEASRLEKVLSSARSICDEMVVVDTGSTDETVEIAERLGARVFHFKWINDFSAARNFSFDQCVGDWILWLDADDIVASEDQQKIATLKDTLNDTLDAVVMLYKYRRNAAGIWIESFPRERLIRRLSGLKWENPVHEGIYYAANPHLKRLDIAVEHYPEEDEWLGKTDRNMAMMEAVIEGGDRSSRNLFIFANDLFKTGQYKKALGFYQEFLQAVDVQAEEKRYIAMVNLMKCCIQEGDEAGGLAYGTEAMTLNSECPEAFLKLGEHYYQNKQWLRAIPFFTAATCLARPTFIPTPDLQYSSYAYFYLCFCYSRLGEFDKAMDFGLQALEREHPDKKGIKTLLHWLTDKI